MLINELLYFAPGVTFDKVDFSGEQLPAQLEQRLRGYYIEPAHLCIEKSHGFAAGVILLSCVDALARFKTGILDQPGSRFVTFVRSELKSFAGNRAYKLYTAFRNGLVHEGRIKSGAQFSLEAADTVEVIQGVLVVNPKHLAGEIEVALQTYVAQLQADAKLRQALAHRLSEDHKADSARRRKR